MQCAGRKFRLSAGRHPWCRTLLLLLLGSVGIWRAEAQDAVLLLTPGPTATTVAGTGKRGYNGDGKAAAAAALAAPSAIAYSAAGDLYIADTRNHAIRRIAADNTITTIAGTGRQGYSGDGGPATQAELDSPQGVAVTPEGVVYVADTRNHRIRRVSAGGMVTTVAGTGIAGFSGDGGKATTATFRNPATVALGLAGELYVADTGNHRIRRIALDGTVVTVAGSGAQEATGDGGLATRAGLDSPSGVSIRVDGALLIADRLNSRIRIVTADGMIATLPGLSLRRPAGVTADAGGTIYVADTGHGQVRAVGSNGSSVVLSGQPVTTTQTTASADGSGAEYVGLAAQPNGSLTVTDRASSRVERADVPQLGFADTIVASASSTKTLLLQNGGLTDLSVQSVIMPAGFSSGGGSDCAGTPFLLHPGQRCTLAIAFTPTAVGAQSGLLTLLVSGAAPQRALLTGLALASGTTLASSTSLRSSGSVSYVGVPITLNISVTGSAGFPVSGTVSILDGATEISTVAVTAGGTAQFVTAALPLGQHALTARYNGDSHYRLSSSAALQQTVVVAPDFTLSAGGASIAAKVGETTSSTVTLQPLNGTLNQAVTVQVTGQPAGTTVNVTPTSLVLAGSPLTVTISMKLPAVLAMQRFRMIGFACVLLCGVSLRGSWRKRMGLSVLTILLISFTGCGGGFLANTASSSQSAAHTYLVTVTASTVGVAGDPLVHTTSFSLVVN